MNVSGKGEQTLGNYKIGKCIGEGTFGKVRLATHILTQEKVAVKTLQKEKIIEQSDIERVTREICILKILRHPNIIQLYEIIETKTDIHLIMEYAEGGELFDYIVKNKRIAEVEAVRFTQQIISGVQYIHKNGIVHRDLKPENLLLDANKNIKIVDFGLSNQYKTGEKLKTACGSPCYAAPQMIAGKKYQCLNVDIWSCGIIIYAMLCGYLPFEDPNTNKLYKKIIAGDFDMPKILSAEGRDILRNVLNVNPQTRYKISQIRNSRWYSLHKPKYEAKGIIVGKDQITPEDAVIRRMEKNNFDPVQTRTYILNNRHNHVTATYYLFQKKIQKQPKPEEEKTPEPQKVEKIEKPKREDSPLIYRPDKKPDYYIPQSKKPKETRDASKNDSINASNIISSLVQANKTKLISQRFVRKPQNGNFDKIEDFKPLPKKLNSSIHESDSGKKPALTNRTGVQESFDTKRTSFTGTDPLRYSNAPNHNNSIDDNTEPLNKKRQELSQQLKQISIKIDKEIVQLRKQNDTIHEGSNIKRQSMGTHNVPINNRKRHSQSFNMGNSKQKISNIGRQTPTSNLNHTINTYTNSRDRMMSQGVHSVNPTIGPKLHVGPFNVKCLFMESANILQRKIIDFLKMNNLSFVENQPFSIKTSENHKIWLESIAGSAGLYLVNFSEYTPINDQLLQVLAK